MYGFYMGCMQSSTHMLGPLSMSKFAENGGEFTFSLSLSII